MSTMRFADEVVPRAEVDGVPSRRTKPEAKALKLATQIIESLASEWKPEQYHDTYTEELKDRIKAKEKGDDTVREDAKPAPATNVVDLMAALEASLAQGRKPAERTTAKKTTGAKKPAAKKSAAKSGGRTKKSA